MAQVERELPVPSGCPPADAEPLFKRSLAIAEKVLGPDHPGFATVLHNLALLYQAQGCYDHY
jgi:hypothetical protein